MTVASFANDLCMAMQSTPFCPSVYSVFGNSSTNKSLPIV